MLDKKIVHVNVSTDRDESSVNFYLTGDEKSQFLKHNIAKAFYLTDIFPNHEKEVLIKKYKDYIRVLLEQTKPKILKALQEKPKINIICAYHKTNIYLDIFLSVLEEILNEVNLCLTTTQDRNLF